MTARKSAPRALFFGPSHGRLRCKPALTHITKAALVVDATKSEPMAIRPDLPPSRIRRHQPRGGATDPTQVRPGPKSAPEPDRAFDLSSDFGEIRPGGEFACRVLLLRYARCRMGLFCVQNAEVALKDDQSSPRKSARGLRATATALQLRAAQKPRGFAYAKPRFLRFREKQNSYPRENSFPRRCGITPKTHVSLLCVEVNCKQR